MSSLIWGGVGGPLSDVEIDLFKDGSVNLRCGTQDVGTGSRIIFAQVAAEELGVDIDNVTAFVGNTDYPKERQRTITCIDGAW